MTGFSIILLVLAIYPRFVVTPGFPFFIKRSVVPDDFVTPPDDDQELLALFRTRCAALANTLYWKILLFHIAMAACLVYIAVLFLLAIGGFSTRFQPRAMPHDRGAAAL